MIHNLKHSGRNTKTKNYYITNNKYSYNTDLETPKIIYSYVRDLHYEAFGKTFQNIFQILIYVYPILFRRKEI